MARKKLLDFKRVGSAVNTSSMKTVGKLFLGGIIGEALPSVFQRVTGKQAHGVAGNAVSGAVSTVVFLAMNQKEMAAGVVATKLIKAAVIYGNPVVHNLTGVPLALPATNDGRTVNTTAQNLNPNASLEDDVPVEMVKLPTGQVIPTRPREVNPTVNYDKPNPELSDFLTAQEINSLSDATNTTKSRFGSDVESMLSDNMPELFGMQQHNTNGF